MEMIRPKIPKALLSRFSSYIRRKTPGIIVALLLTVTLLPGRQAVCQSVYREEVVQSAILFSIAQFVEWPASSFTSTKSPFRVCVFGEDLLQKEIMQWQKRSYFGRPIEVHVITELEELQEEISKYHVIYIADNKWKFSDQIVSLTKNIPILSASDDDTFFRKGGIVSFIDVDGKMKFCLNLDISVSTGLQISSKLFTLSLFIIKDGTVMERK